MKVVLLIGSLVLPRDVRFFYVNGLCVKQGCKKAVK
jgi:hypothetical protein